MNADPIAVQIAQAQSEYQRGNIPAARQLIEGLAKVHPDRADIRLAQGMIQMASGDLESALNSFTKSLEASPDSTDALGSAAFVCMNMRRFDDAEMYARRLTQIAPNNLRAFYLLSSSLRAQDRFDEALTMVDKALVIKPDDVDCLVLKARILKSLRMPALSIEIYRQAISIRPTPAAAVDLAKILLKESHPEAALDVLHGIEPYMSKEAVPHALFAESLAMMRQFDEADSRWKLASQLSPNKISVTQQRAKVEIATGRFEIAQRLLGDLINRGIDVPTSFQILTTARKMTEEDLPLIERMVEAGKSASLSPGELSELHYGLGKSFDDLKDYERAIGQFDLANQYCLEIYPLRRNFETSQLKSITDLMIASFTPDIIQKLTQDGLPSHLPLFVVGMMRSGTTLTETILSAHSKVVGGGEQSFWTERAIEFIHTDHQGLNYDHDTVLKFAADYLAFVDPHREDIHYFVDKNPANFDLAGSLHCALPNAKFVHLKRHPVDNLLSLWMTRMSGNVAYASKRENLVFAYREYLRLWKHWESVLPADRFATFNYEDLTGQPKATIDSMLDFLELDHEEACYSPEANIGTVLTPSVFQVRQPINIRSQQRWKNYEPWLGEFRELLDDI